MEREMELYAWQRECLNVWSRNGCRGVLSVATGAGKTYFAIEAAESLRKKLSVALYIKIVVPTETIAKQWEEALRGRRGKEVSVGHYNGRIKNYRFRDYVIYIVNSARYTLSGHILAHMEAGEGVLLIADECHHYGSEENSRIFSFLYSDKFREELYYSLGLSATPRCKNYESRIVPALGTEIFRYGYREAIADGVVSPFFLFQISFRFTAAEQDAYCDLTEKLRNLYRRLLKDHPDLGALRGERFFEAVNGYAGDDGEDSPAFLYRGLVYRRKLLDYMAENRLLCARELIYRMEKTSRIILFCERIEQADRLYEGLQRELLENIVRFHSEMSPEGKKYSMEQFRNGGSRILVCCRALDEGMDVPEASVGIVVSGTAVTRQRMQRLGRLLRRKTGQRPALLYYLYNRDSAEEKRYLPPDSGAAKVFELSYLPEANDFTHGEYDRLAARVWKKKHEPGRMTGQDLELRKCIQEGALFPDWAMPVSYCEEKKRHSRSNREYNYWTCMKWMREEYERNGA